ncbi:similar to ALBINO OR PALE-GREEN 13 [Actinidia rufa]|uniref:UDP-N-acetylmuramoyl-L-alanyl-D-glutamate--2,6-diaminopimelate ligase MurE homolog, chloroplastic n=1 Tax=Actinidia rufa TaxID=165716 RepID=A0A7J0DMB4_9ERIC|nr:similar to ALBINO OR PALE-GREEN 13 [Actinidia rufa]
MINRGFTQQNPSLSPQSPTDRHCFSNGTHLFRPTLTLSLQFHLSLASKPQFSFHQFRPSLSSHSLSKNPIRPPFAIGSDGKFYPTPADDDPPEADEDSTHGVDKFEQIKRQAARARKLQEEQLKKDQPTFLNAIADVEDASDDDTNFDNSGDDMFGDIDRAISMKRKEFVKQGLLKPNPKKEKGVPEGIAEGIEELEPEEVVDLEEIKKLQGLTVISADSGEGSDESENEVSDDMGNGEISDLSSFDIDFDDFGKTKARIVDPKFRMTLAELLDESKVVPVSVYGNLEVEISGIHHDSRLIEAGDLFVCCVGRKTDGHLYLTEADKRGAAAVVASKEIDIEETLGCKALVIVEDTNSVLPALAAAFYQFPTTNMSVIGITGTNGKTTTSYLIKKAVVMEASSHGLALGRCNEVDFDIAVFTNLTRDHLDFHGSEEDYREAKAKLFSRMVDPERHRKIVNIDDPNAAFFIAQGNPDVPVVTYAMENKNADVHPLKFELSLFETQVLVNTPQGILEISSGLLGRHNIYNMLAAVAVGIAVGAPLEDIVRGIEEVDAVPGRCELIDEEQAFGVIVDYAHSPDALSRLLDFVRELGPRRIITVIGCGGDRDRGKRPIMAKIATDKSDVTLLTSDNPRSEDPLDILDDMLAGVGWTMQDYLKYGENDYYPPLPNGHRLFLHDIRRVAVRAAVAMGEEGDMIVVAGKGHETYQIEGDKTEFFDDREECREALQYVDELHRAGIDTSEFPWRLPESH